MHRRRWPRSLGLGRWRERVWALAGEHAPTHWAEAEVSAARPLVIDVDATLSTARSDKEQAAPTFERGDGFHKLTVFCDHGREGTGEPLAFLLRKGNAGSNTAADHITVLRAALAQLPDEEFGTRPRRKVLVRTDGAGCTHELVEWLVRRRLSYSVGFTLPTDFERTLKLVLEKAWAEAYVTDGAIRPGRWSRR